MNKVEINQAHWRLHRILLRRIVLAAGLIAAILAATTYFASMRDMHHMAVTLASSRAAEFAATAGDALASQPGEVQARLDQFVKGRLPPRDGRIVAATIYTATGQPAASIALPDHAQRSDLVEFLAKQQPQTNVTEAFGHAVSVSGVQVYFVQAPLLAADGQVLGYVLGLFEPSEYYLAQLQNRMWRNVIAAIIIVLITTAILYPVILRLMRRVTTLSGKLLDANLEILSVLGSAIAKRDADTDAHNYRVTIYSVRLAEAAGLDTRTIQTLIKGAFLHDVGKIGIPDNILLKPGKLDEKEYTQMKLHVAHGLDIVRRASWLADAEAVVGGHHEKVNGSGYDGKLKTDEIPVVARIFAIADVFDALTSHRPYKEPLSFDATMEIMARDRGTHFDPQLLDTFATIARPLHQSLAGVEGEYPRQEVQRMLTRYFRENVEMLLTDDLSA